MDLGIDLSQEMRPIISPSLIEANYILSLSQLELQEAIHQELLANPALELADHAVCPTCGGILEAAFCTTCRLSHQAERRETSYEDYPEVLTQQTAQGFSEDDFDPLNLVATELGLRDQILSDASTLLCDDDLPIAAWLIDCLDDRGYLTTPLAVVAAEFAISEDRVERILELIQQIAPVGVAARDMRESLLLQIDYLTHLGAPSPPSVRQIVAEHLEDLASHKHGYIASQLGISADEVEAAREFIRNQLSPSPSSARRRAPGAAPIPTPTSPPTLSSRWSRTNCWWKSSRPSTICCA